MKRLPPNSLGMRARSGNATMGSGGTGTVMAAIPSVGVRMFRAHVHPRGRQGAVRTLAVYAFGEGWTGALGSGSLASHSPDSGRGFVRVDLDPTARGRRGSKRKEPIVRAVAAGWGHTAVVVQDREDSTDAGNDAAPRPPRLLVCGRPHEFRTLLRLNRLPDFVRNLAIRYSFWHTHDSSLMDNNANAADSSSSGAASSSAGPGPGPWGRLVGSGGPQEHMEEKKDDAGAGGAFSFFSAINALGRDHQYGSSSTSCILPHLTEMSLPYGDSPATTATTTTGGGKFLAASAGFTAVIGSSNSLYAFGLNPYGQCGVGYDSNNVWVPTPVVGLSTQFAGDVGGRAVLEREFPIASVALGLQHGVGLDVEGNLFAWGKGERGQLGDGRNSNSNVAVPIPVRLRRWSEDGDDADVFGPALRVTRIAAGFNHSACVTDCNRAFVWGKNVTTEGVADADTASDGRGAGSDGGGGGGRVIDAPRPVPIHGLPPEVPILDISCGSHHTALLLADGSVYAIGIATDDGTPLLDRAVPMIRPGGILPVEWLPLRQFVSGFDRTTIVSGDGRRVLEVKLWSREELRDDPTAVREPDWFGRLREEVGAAGGDGGGGGADVRVRMVDRGWLHTVVVTDDEATEEAMDYDRASDGGLLAGAGAAAGTL